jgi:hypothetical protein
MNVEIPDRPDDRFAGPVAEQEEAPFAKFALGNIRQRPTLGK